MAIENAEAMTGLGRPTWLEIDLARIRGNYSTVRDLVPVQTHIMCVLKDDAYGHGAVRVAGALQEAGADWFALTTLEEALKLRNAGITGRMLVFGNVPKTAVPLAIRHHIAMSIPSQDAGQEMSTSAGHERVTVHLKVDTGMGRAGVLADGAMDALRSLHELENVDVEGLYSHFSCADSDASYSSMQFRRFEKLLHQATVEGIRPPIAHISNSAGILTMKQAMLEAVRPGLLLYGLSPLEGVPIPGLKPALSFKTRVVACKEVPAGYGISYGRTYLTFKPTLVALLPVGYSDGYSRMLSNKASVLIRGRRAPVIGRVTMDIVMVDVSDVPGVRVGDEVVLIGEAGGQRITAGDLGSLMRSISWEVLTLVGKLVPRVYLDGDSPAP
jgi:alanine racemase